MAFRPHPTWPSRTFLMLTAIAACAWLLFFAGAGYVALHFILKLW